MNFEPSKTKGNRSDSDRGEKIIFVGGAARSGTTLLQNMLDCHPDVIAGPEFLHLEAICRLRRELRQSHDRGWTSSYYSTDDADRAIVELVEKLLLPLREKFGAKFISEKTPGNVLVFEDLLELYPKARFINLTRDPRAVVSSMLQVGKRAAQNGLGLQSFTRDVQAAVEYQQACLKAGWEAGNAAPDRVLHVAYEKLVSDPTVETRRICEFLELPWDQSMISPACKSHLGEVPITDGSGNIWYNKDTFNRNPDTQTIYSWQTKLKPTQKVYIYQAYAGFDPAEQFGYVFDSDSPYAQGKALAKLIVMMYKTKRRIRMVVGNLT